MSAITTVTEILPDFDREKEIKAFDESKAGVKGLVDSGISTIPRIFIDPPENYPIRRSSSQINSVPVIDLSGLDSDRRKDIIVQVRKAAGNWGFLQVVNHGIVQSLLDDMISGAVRFNESPQEEKVQFYTRDLNKKVLFASTFDIYVMKRANWRDTMHCHTAPDLPSPHELPLPLRELVPQYSKCISALGETLLKLFAEGLGLPANYLIDIECMRAQTLSFHYYPACPQPELTHGASKHSDPSFFTILLQDHIGGLQALHQGQWIDVDPIQGALVVNIGDLLQLVSNGKFLSVEHRVLANHVGPRASVACFFKGTGTEPTERRYGPIKELLSEGNHPQYKQLSMKEYYAHFHTKGIDGISFLDAFKAS